MLCSSARTLSIASKMVCVNQGEKTNGVASTMKQWLLETSCLRTAAVISELLAECWQGDCGSADNKIVGLQMFIGANVATGCQKTNSAHLRKGDRLNHLNSDIVISLHQQRPHQRHKRPRCLFIFPVSCPSNPTTIPGAEGTHHIHKTTGHGCTVWTESQTRRPCDKVTRNG